MRVRFRAGAVVLTAVIVTATACSGSSGSTPATGTNQPTPHAAATASGGASRPAGAAAELSPISGGKGPYIASATPAVLSPHGYIEQEYLAAGTATS
jgi:hypothetical protein